MENTHNATVLLSVAETARRLDIHEKTVFKWIAAGKLTAVRLTAKCTRLRLSDVEAFINAGNRQAAQPTGTALIKQRAAAAKRAAANKSTAQK